MNPNPRNPAPARNCERPRRGEERRGSGYAYSLGKSHHASGCRFVVSDARARIVRNAISLTGGAMFHPRICHQMKQKYARTVSNRRVPPHIYLLSKISGVYCTVPHSDVTCFDGSLAFCCRYGTAPIAAWKLSHPTCRTNRVRDRS
jgi:hypothetical protein